MNTRYWIALALALMAILINACAPANSATVAPSAPQPARPPTAAPTETPSQPAAATLPEIKVDAADYSYTAPETVSAGWVRVHPEQFRNRTASRAVPTAE